MDFLFFQVGYFCGLNEIVIFFIIFKEFIIWVDLFDVFYCIGENGSIGVFFEFDNIFINDNLFFFMLLILLFLLLFSGSEFFLFMFMMFFLVNLCKGQFMSEFLWDMGFK